MTDKSAAEGLVSSPARPQLELPRYFVNINGFSDDTRYVRADADGRCFGIDKHGKEWLYTAGSLAGFIEKVQRGIWREMSQAEISQPEPLAEGAVSAAPPALTE